MKNLSNGDIVESIDLKPNQIIKGSLFPEPVRIITLVPMGDSIKLIGEGMHSGKVHQPILSPIANL